MWGKMHKDWAYFLICMTALLALVFVPSSRVWAGAKTSVKIGDTRYNLVIFDRDEYPPVFEKITGALARENYPGTLEYCKLVIDLPVGTAQGNHSYGGLCTIKHEETYSKVMVCHDEMLGRLATAPLEAGKVYTINQLIKFVAAHCYGG